MWLLKIRKNEEPVKKIELIEKCKIQNCNGADAQDWLGTGSLSKHL